MLARGALLRLKHKVDPRRYNGALFLGLGCLCEKLGVPTEFDLRTLLVAVESITNSLNEKIKSGCALVAPHLSASDAGAIRRRYVGE